MDKIEISVVIPFYNAKEYVIQAVESALMQPETGEVLLVEDKSPDEGLLVCQTLAEKYPIVKLLRHPDGENHGAAASRNLGIKNAFFPYIAFLDADDYFLPNRFSKTTDVFRTQDKVDGVYEAIGVTYENEAVKQLFSKLSFPEITTIKKKVEPGQLFSEIISGKIGHFSFDGFTVHKDILEKVGGFSEKLKIYEDTDLMFKLCAKANLFPGSIDVPVAVRRVHEHNRITFHLADKRKSYSTYITLWQSLLTWGKVNLPHEHQRLIFHRLISHLRKIDTFPDFTWKDFMRSRATMIRSGKSYHEGLADAYLWRRIIPSREIFSRSQINASKVNDL